ncbi:hypothetical protein TVAG_138370 [Trichomonas vaginalis G3]|uniref:UDENN domain-containing protein n=1 Tax=Trichomonas vaginalis (strain ATCC PRA-98 / G3) TaxID=412133 RepID=A2ENJ0_TRIV3|nr:Rab guanyl-nucleotide exchange factor protein [Trichomonas vaginalis G3]EAY05768.1 hypothetical protein TVAG_138370 [Trichomonas vaginalis G3]KAI5511409.1 Rab guanyl-nucleotide exchange factor protein [Trichomonas vaginalis G3]|eukprot:XP_001317991.1 hypothetical protein [Trichomonas vaginalis G3]
MLRFCTEGGPLIDYVFNIIVSKADTKFDVAFEQVYPKEPADPKFVNTFKVFVYPDANAIESNSFFNFIIGDTAVDFNHGFIKYDNNTTGRCIISKYYYPTLFKKLLVSHKNDLQDIAKVLVVEPNQTEINVDGKDYQLSGASEKQKLLKIIFKTFSPFEISKIIINMLEARHIFPISLNLSKLSRAVAALPLLIEPFRWNMNQIPVLPIALKDATNIPVPTMIGISDPTILLEGRIDNHILVNLDTFCVVENPPFNVDSPKALDVLTLQLGFQNQVTDELKHWAKLKSFPHKHIQKIIRLFISEYLMIFTGRVRNVNDFVAATSKFPEALAESQVIHDLAQLDALPPQIKSRFNDFFAEIFNGSAPQVKLYKSPSSSCKQNAMSISPSKPELVKQQPDLLGISDGQSDNGQTTAEAPQRSSSMSFNPFFDMSTPASTPSKEETKAVGFGPFANQQTTQQAPVNEVTDLFAPGPARNSADLFAPAPSNDLFGQTTPVKDIFQPQQQSTPINDLFGQTPPANRSPFASQQTATPNNNPFANTFVKDPFSSQKAQTPGKDFFGISSSPVQPRNQPQVSMTLGREDNKPTFISFDAQPNSMQKSSSNTFDPFADFSAGQGNMNPSPNKSSNAFDPFISPMVPKTKKPDRNSNNFDLFS